MRKIHESPEMPIEERIESIRDDFSRCQKCIVELMDTFKDIDAEKIDNTTLFIFEKALPEAVDCIEAFCESVLMKKC